MRISNNTWRKVEEAMCETGHMLEMEWGKVGICEPPSKSEKICAEYIRGAVLKAGEMKLDYLSLFTSGIPGIVSFWI